MQTVAIDGVKVFLDVDGPYDSLGSVPSVPPSEKLLEEVPGIVSAFPFLTGCVSPDEDPTKLLLQIGRTYARLDYPVHEVRSLDVPLLRFVDLEEIRRLDLVLVLHEPVVKDVVVAVHVKVVVHDGGFPNSAGLAPEESLVEVVYATDLILDFVHAYVISARLLHLASELFPYVRKP